jgi:hypothetical protein
MSVMTDLNRNRSAASVLPGRCLTMDFSDGSTYLEIYNRIR